LKKKRSKTAGPLGGSKERRNRRKKARGTEKTYTKRPNKKAINLWYRQFRTGERVKNRKREKGGALSLYIHISFILETDWEGGGINASEEGDKDIPRAPDKGGKSTGEKVKKSPRREDSEGGEEKETGNEKKNKKKIFCFQGQERSTKKGSHKRERKQIPF